MPGDLRRTGAARLRRIGERLLGARPDDIEAIEVHPRRCRLHRDERPVNAGHLPLERSYHLRCD